MVVTEHSVLFEQITGHPCIPKVFVQRCTAFMVDLVFSRLGARGSEKRVSTHVDDEIRLLAQAVDHRGQCCHLERVADDGETGVDMRPKAIEEDGPAQRSRDISESVVADHHVVTAVSSP